MPVSAAGTGGLGPEVFRLVIEFCPGGIVVVGADSSIRMVNSEVERLFGYARDELLDQPIEILLPERVRAMHATLHHAFMARPVSHHLGEGRDLVGRHKDGSEVPVEVGLNWICVGDDVFIVAVIVDLRARKRVERMRDEFVATVSHELRTPMTSVTASLGLLLAGKPVSVPQPAAHLLQIAQMNCQRLVRILNDILDLKRLESGEMPFHYQVCNAGELLEKGIESNRSLAESCGVGIRLNAPAASLDIDVDPDRFIQVIVNLLSNAVKFSPPGQDVVVTGERRGERVRITVLDHGPGVPAAFRSRVFVPFAQADVAATQHKVGSGLGLSIARKITMEMHGNIGFEGVPGGGTVFYVDFPRSVGGALP